MDLRGSRACQCCASRGPDAGAPKGRVGGSRALQALVPVSGSGPVRWDQLGGRGRREDAGRSRGRRRCPTRTPSCGSRRRPRLPGVCGTRQRAGICGARGRLREGLRGRHFGRLLCSWKTQEKENRLWVSGSKGGVAEALGQGPGNGLERRGYRVLSRSLAPGL